MTDLDLYLKNSKSDNEVIVHNCDIYSNSFHYYKFDERDWVIEAIEKYYGVKIKISNKD